MNIDVEIERFIAWVKLGIDDPVVAKAHPDVDFGNIHRALGTLVGKKALRIEIVDVLSTELLRKGDRVVFVREATLVPALQSGKLAQVYGVPTKVGAGTKAVIVNYAEGGGYIVLVKGNDTYYHTDTDAVRKAPSVERLPISEVDRSWAEYPLPDLDTAACNPYKHSFAWIAPDGEVISVESHDYWAREQLAGELDVDEYDDPHDAGRQASLELMKRGWLRAANAYSYQGRIQHERPEDSTWTSTSFNNDAAWRAAARVAVECVVKNKVDPEAQDAYASNDRMSIVEFVERFGGRATVEDMFARLEEAGGTKGSTETMADWLTGAQGRDDERLPVASRLVADYDGSERIERGGNAYLVAIQGVMQNRAFVHVFREQDMKQVGAIELRRLTETPKVWERGPCASGVRDLLHHVGGAAEVYVVTYADVVEGSRKLGLGRVAYDFAIRALSEDGPVILVGDHCAGGTSSQDAKRAWVALAKQWASSGWAVLSEPYGAEIVGAPDDYAAEEVEEVERLPIAGDNGTKGSTETMADWLTGAQGRDGDTERLSAVGAAVVAADFLAPDPVPFSPSPIGLAALASEALPVESLPVVFHGSRHVFPLREARPGGGYIYGPGVYFTTDEAEARRYATDKGQVLACDVSLQNPIYFHRVYLPTDQKYSQYLKQVYPNVEVIRRWISESRNADEHVSPEEAVRELQALGFDGIVVYLQEKESDPAYYVVSSPEAANLAYYIVFDPVQSCAVNASDGATTVEQLPVHTSAFRKWFGKSKVVDVDGAPLVVYHGTDRAFDVFNFSAGINAPVRNAVYFSDSPELASYVASFSWGGSPQVLPVYLKIEHPLVVDAKGQHAIRLTDEIDVKLAQARGRAYDGVVIHNVREFQQDELTTTYAVFKPTQIKSATGNRGTFDPNDPSIERLPVSGNSVFRFDKVKPWELTLAKFLAPYPEPRPGYLPLFHYTGASLDAIVQGGLKRSAQSGDVNAVFAHRNPAFVQNDKPLVVFQAPADEIERESGGGSVTVLYRNVSPQDILAVHDMWPHPVRLSLPYFRSDVAAKYLDEGRLIHRKYVEAALKRGERVPLEVLADYPDLQPATADNVERLPVAHAGMPSERIRRKRIKDAALKGEAGRFWYDKAEREIRTVARNWGVDPIYVAVAVAATSPATRVILTPKMARGGGSSSNIGKARRVVKALVVGKSALDVVHPKSPGASLLVDFESCNYTPGTSLASCLDAAFPNPDTTKTHAFVRNLLGDKDAVTVDSIVAKGAGVPIGKNKAPLVNDTRYRLITADIRAVAKTLGWAPREVMAAAWTGWGGSGDLGLATREERKHAGADTSTDANTERLPIAAAPQVPDDISERYSYGGCIWFALALHDRYKWPIYAQIETHPGGVGDYVSHAYVKHPNGTEVDVLGPQEQVDIFSPTVRKMSRHAFVTYVEETTGLPVEAQYRQEKPDADRVIDQYIEPLIQEQNLKSKSESQVERLPVAIDPCPPEDPDLYATAASFRPGRAWRNQLDERHAAPRKGSGGKELAGWRKAAEDARSLLLKHGVKLGDVLGCGTFACAWKIEGRPDLVAKITGDPSEAAAWSAVIAFDEEERPAALARTFCVEAIPGYPVAGPRGRGTHQNRRLYLIIQEQLAPLSNREKRFINDKSYEIRKLGGEPMPYEKMSAARHAQGRRDIEAEATEKLGSVARAEAMLGLVEAIAWLRDVAGVDWRDLHGGNVLVAEDVSGNGRYRIGDLGVSSSGDVDVPMVARPS